ncbi:DUF814-domain-containing protein [Dunaliella salina]|uniref:DUF814-domain-containing protein n=1 Tax=Dunaliella salina TaxID=3046 RepID=A0ABQ7GTF8_DUNSA|nr:DUF814-domain-containing protein [Dunaliella salina]|eukprot:KAF5837895.1 DUF814-domain-containing protein [Dunaliella salina]
MVFYFSPKGHTQGEQAFLIYMGRDKFENEHLIRYALPIDVWFHVDDLSSAHVYLRLPEGIGLDDIPKETLDDCCQLVKHNSIQGCKQNNVGIVYTMASNLKKTSHMEIGQVSFHNEKAIKKVKVERKVNEILNRLEKTRTEVEKPDLEGEKERYDAKKRSEHKAQVRNAKEEEKALKAEQMKEKELREYRNLMKEENMLSNKEISEKYKSAEEYEEDFM